MGRHAIGNTPAVCVRSNGSSKTPASQRWMPLDRSLAEKLRQHRLIYISPENNEGWIFANPNTGKPYWPSRIQESWLVPAAEKAGLGRIGWHTFRHSHSSLQISSLRYSPAKHTSVGADVVFPLKNNQAASIAGKRASLLLPLFRTHTTGVCPIACLPNRRHTT